MVLIHPEHDGQLVSHCVKHSLELRPIMIVLEVSLQSLLVKCFKLRILSFHVLDFDKLFVVSMITLIFTIEFFLLFTPVFLVTLAIRLLLLLLWLLVAIGLSWLFGLHL